MLCYRGPDGTITLNVDGQQNLLNNISADFSAGHGFTVATLNLDHMVKLTADDTFRQAYIDHKYVTADGRPIVWLSKLAGTPCSLVTGSDLIQPLLQMCEKDGISVGFFGSNEDTLNVTKARLLETYPNLSISYVRAPAMGFDPTGAEAMAAIEEMRETGVSLVLLALGAPKQEVFASFAAQHLPSVGFLSIGAGLDFIAGTQVRAPKFMRMIAAEWVWRLALNPKRLAGRYLSSALLLPGLVIRAWRKKPLKP